MSHPGEMVNISINGQERYQRVDGFGVNINSKYFDQHLLNAMDLLVNDLRANLYRVDIWGKSNWIDPTGEVGRAALDPVYQAQIYDGEIFRRGWSMMRFLNEHGIQPYLTASGIVPSWMLGSDGKTLVDFESFTGMMVEMLAWARNQEKLDFHLFGPLNETDIGDPEGPTVNPADYTRICELLVEKLDGRGLSDIKLVIAEQAHFNTSYLEAIAKSKLLEGRIGAFGLHTYFDYPIDRYREAVSMVDKSRYQGTPIWMSEFGDLEQSGDREWYIAWKMVSRMFDFLEAGFNGGIVWDAYDNYHDHNEYWTIYGLLRTGLYVHTPKKRYHALKHFYRFVPPNSQRIGASADHAGIRVLAFEGSPSGPLVLVGVNSNPFTARLNVKLENVSERKEGVRSLCFQTTEEDNCVQTGSAPLYARNWPFNGIDLSVQPFSIFTITVE
jgi:hypothetical protein